MYEELLQRGKGERNILQTIQGRKDGKEEGRKVGRKEGWKEGRNGGSEEGRK